MLKNKRLKEAIDDVGMVNNLDSQDFDKKSVGTAPVSYADAVLRARKRKEACKKAYEDQVEVARRALRKEVSNEEHPEPLGKIRGNKERKMTLDEGLFESFEDEHLGGVELKEWMPSHAVWVKKDGKWKPYSALDFDTLSDEEVAAFKSLGYDDVKLLPNDGSEPDEVETLSECAHTELREGIEEKKVYRITYKHSPEVFSSVMVKAASEDEAKQKLAVKMPDKDIVGVSVMSDYEVKDMINRGMSLMEAKVIDEFSSYEPWGAAVSTFDNIQNAGKMDALEHLIDDMYPDGIDRTELNDLLAFESDWVYSMLNMSSEEGVDEEEDGPAVDFDEEE